MSDSENNSNKITNSDYPPLISLKKKNQTDGNTGSAWFDRLLISNESNNIGENQLLTKHQIIKIKSPINSPSEVNFRQQSPKLPNSKYLKELPSINIDKNLKNEIIEDKYNNSFEIKENLSIKILIIKEENISKNDDVNLEDDNEKKIILPVRKIIKKTTFRKKILTMPVSNEESTIVKLGPKAKAKANEVAEFERKEGFSDLIDILNSNKSEWIKIQSALERVPKAIQRLLLNTENISIPLTHNQFTNATLQHVLSLRTTLARAAIGALLSCLEAISSLGETPDANLCEPILSTLMKRLASPRDILTEEVELCINIYNTIIWPNNRILPVLVGLANQKQALVRKKTAEMFALHFSKLPEAVLNRIGSTIHEQERIIPGLLGLLRDGNSTTRSFARQAVVILSHVPNWTTLVSRFATESQLADIMRAIET